MEKYSKFAEAKVCSPSEFRINFVKVQLFPHLNFVVSVGGDVVNSCSPLVAVVPIEGLCLSPSRANRNKQDDQ